MQEHTGMFTALVFSVVGLQQTELPSYGTGEKTAYLIRCGRKTLEVTTLRAAWRMILIVIMDHCQALVHQQVLKLRKRLRVMRFLSKDQMKTTTIPSVQSLNPLNLQDFKVRNSHKPSQESDYDCSS